MIFWRLRRNLQKLLELRKGVHCPIRVRRCWHDGFSTYKMSIPYSVLRTPVEFLWLSAVNSRASRTIFSDILPSSAFCPTSCSTIEATCPTSMGKFPAKIFEYRLFYQIAAHTCEFASSSIPFSAVCCGSLVHDVPGRETSTGLLCKIFLMRLLTWVPYVYFRDEKFS